MWESMLTIFLILFLANAAVTVLVFWLMRRFYAARFDRLAKIIQEAMALRDAQIQKFEARFADALIKDTKIIDDLLDDFSDVVPADAEIEEEAVVGGEGELDEREGELDEREGEDS